MGIQVVTAPLFVRDRVAEDHRALAFAGALLAASLPSALLALLGGVAADRVERRRILVRTHTAAALVSTLYLVLAGFDVRAVWPVFLLAAVVGSVGAFAQPARQSMVPQMLPRSQLQNGIILGTVAFMASAQFFGLMIGGLVADGAGLPEAFGLEVLLILGAVAYSA